MTERDDITFASELPAPDQVTERQWVQLLPLGEARMNDGRKPLRVENAEAIIAASARHIERGMAVDFNHAMDSDDRTRPAPAAGWVERLEARADGIYGEIAWTSEGRDKIAGRVYRYISPVLLHDKAGRVTAILRAGLTNTPALAMRAICTDMGPEPGAKTQSGEALAQATIDSASEAQLRSFARSILERLGISSQERLQTALDRLPMPVAGPPHDGQRSSATQTGQLDAFADLLLSRAQADHERDVAQMLSAAQSSGALPPALKDWGKALASSDPASFRRFVASSPFASLSLDKPMLTGQPPRAAGADSTGAAASICAQLGLKPGALD